MKKIFFKFVSIGLCIGFCALMLFSNPAEAGFIGNTMDAVYYYPDIFNPYPSAAFTPNIFVVTSGVETIGNIEDVTFLNVDFTDQQLTITFDTILSNPTWGSASFNGIIFTGQATTDFDISDAVIGGNSTLAGFDDSRVTFGGNQIGINWQGLSYSDGQRVVIDFTFSPAPSPVPEPNTMFLMGCGVIGVLGFRRGFKK